MANKNKNNFLYIGIAVFVIIVLAIVFISNSNNDSQNEVTCNSPYIKVGTECCLDQNSNNVCDTDETLAQNQQAQQQENCHQTSIPYNDEECKYQEYVYAIENQKNSIEGDKLKLEYDFVNRDTEKILFKGGATWIINNEEVYFKEYDPEICCNYEVYPGSRITVTKYFENPSAQQTGRYNVIVPQKYVCETVTKYREETVCN